jgi:hypothetical protein
VPRQWLAAGSAAPVEPIEQRDAIGTNDRRLAVQRERLGSQLEFRHGIRTPFSG